MSVKTRRGLLVHERARCHAPTISVGSADVETATRFGIPLNAPVTEVRRVIKGGDDSVIYLGEVAYRGDFIHREMDLKP